MTDFLLNFNNHFSMILFDVCPPLYDLSLKLLPSIKIITIEDLSQIPSQYDIPYLVHSHLNYNVELKLIFFKQSTLLYLDQLQINVLTYNYQLYQGYTASTLIDRTEMLNFENYQLELKRLIDLHCQHSIDFQNLINDINSQQEEKFLRYLHYTKLTLPFVLVVCGVCAYHWYL